MKKIVTLVLVMSMVLTLIACGAGKTPEATTAAAPAPVATTAEPNAETEAAPAVEFEKLFLLCGNAAQDGDSLDTAMDSLVEELNKQTGGAVTGSVTPASGLGGHSDMISAVQLGSMQVAEATASVLSSVAPKFAVCDIPYMVPNSAYGVYDLLSGEAGEILNQNLIESAGLRVISWMCRTPRHVYSATHPVEKLDDWKGMKIRTMQSTAMTKAMELLGATPTAIATAERYMALQTGVVEAAENNVAEIYNCAEYEVTKYLSKTGHLCSPNVIYVSEDWFQSLSPEMQELLLKVGKEAGRLATQIESESEADFESKLVSEGGMIVNEISEAELARFRETLAPLYDEYKDVLGEDLITLMQG